MGRNASVLNPWQLAQQWNRGSTKYGKNYGFGDYGLTKGKEAGLNKLGKDLQRANEDESDSSDFDDDSLPDDSLPDDPTDDPTSNDGKRDSEEFDREYYYFSERVASARVTEVITIDPSSEEEDWELRRRFKVKDGFAPVPEPNTALMVGFGIAGIAGYARKRRR